MKKFSWILSCAALAVCLLFILPSEAHAAEIVDCGTCGKNLNWTLNDEGTLIISGMGDMYSYYWDMAAPWYSHQIPIKSVIIQEGVTKIGSCAFYNCSSLTNVSIPESVTSIGDLAFYNCSNLIYNEYDNAKYLGNTNNPYAVLITAASSIETCKIHEDTHIIYESAFSGCTSLTNITIPNSVVSIGNYAFNNCSNLASITIPNSVTSISYCAFADCSSLTSINIPNSVTSIGEGALSGCYNLKNMTIPFIGESRKTASDTYQYPFGYIFGTAGYAGGIAIRQYYYGSSTTETTSDSYVIPVGLEYVTVTGGEIPYGAFFHCSGLSKITILDGPTSIGNCAFDGCSGLRSITIPGSVVSIGGLAFKDCISLADVIYCGSPEQWDFMIIFGTNDQLLNANRIYHSYDEWAAADGTTHQRTCSFCGNKETDSHIWGNQSCSVCGVTGGNCGASIGSILDNDSTLVISGSGAMYNYQGAIETRPWHSNRAVVTKLFIEKGVTNVGTSAFEGCSSLTNIIIPDSVTKIGQNAFSNCSELESIIYCGTQEQWDAIVIDNGNELLKEASIVFHDFSQYTKVDDATHICTCSICDFEVCGDHVYGNDYLHCTVCEHIRHLTQISIAVSPQKTQYVQKSEDLDLIGGIIELLFNDGKIVKLSMTEATVSGFDNSTLGQNTIIVSYGGVYTTFSVEIIKATVTFLDDDGTILQSGEYLYGEDISPPVDPVKTADNTYAYSFAGWDKEIVNCAGDATYTATYTPSYINYTVVFKNWDGSVLSTKTYHWGDVVAAPASPAKEADDTFTYAFAGWDDDVVACAGNTTYTAIYTRQRKDGLSYSIQDGEVTITGYAGTSGSVTIPDIIESLPVTSIGVRSFAGCTNLTNITIPNGVISIGDMAFYGCTNLYSIDLGNSVVSIGDMTFSYCRGLTSIVVPISVVNIGDSAFANCNNLQQVIYCGTEEQWSNISVGNNNDIFINTHIHHHMVNGICSFCGYGADVEYTITFKNWNGDILSVDSYHWGDVVTAPASPTKVADNTYTYTFNGWDHEIVRCAGNATYTATYIPSYINYTVVFKNWDGTVLSTKTYHWSDVITTPANPTKAADNTYTYAFKDWGKPVATTCAGDATYTATYTSTHIDYVVTFKDYNGTIISSKTYHYGDTVTVPANPFRAADNTYTYTFKDWGRSVAATCDGNAEYTAVYTPKFIDYTVVFKNWDGSVISTKTYHYGDVITVPANPTKAADNTYAYAFKCWDKAVTNCAGNAIYTATYTSTYINYTVVFKDWNGKILSTKTYHWSDKVTAPVDPTKVADNTYTYAFAGWDKAVVNCAGDATYTATYTSAYINYTIVFKNWNGTVLSTKAYHFGDIVTVPANPSRPSDDAYIYTFTGWDKTVVPCNGDTTYTAVYSSQTRVPSAITSSTYTVSGTTISKISTGTTVATLVGKLNEGQYVKVYNGIQEVSGSTLIGTGMVIKIMDGNTAKATYTIVVTGDTNGDGKITVTDMLAVKAHVLKKSTLTGASAQAADTSGDNAISITDFIQMKAQILGKSNVEPRAVNASAQQLSTASVEPEASVTTVTTEYTTNAADKTVSTLNYTQVVAVIPDKKSLAAL